MAERKIVLQHLLESPYADCATTTLCALSPQKPLDATIAALHNNTIQTYDLLAALQIEYSRIGRIIQPISTADIDRDAVALFRSAAKSSTPNFEHIGGMFVTQELPDYHVIAVKGYHPSNDSFNVWDTSPHATHYVERRMTSRELRKRVYTDFPYPYAVALFSTPLEALYDFDGMHPGFEAALENDLLSAQYHMYELLHRNDRFYLADQI